MADVGAAIPCRHIQFLQSCSDQVDIAEILTPEKVRGLMQATVDRCAGLLDESHKVWQLWLEWEKSLGGDLHQLYLDRLGVPHASESM